MNSKAYILGFLCGILIVALCVGLRYFFKKKCHMNGNEYDECQRAIQGTGYKYAYFTAIIVIMLGGIIEALFDFQWCNLMMLALLGLWISLCVFITYCVIQNAYFSLRCRRKPIMIVMFLAGILNLIIGLCSAADSGLIENGHLNLYAGNLLTALCCIYLAVMMFCRTIWERRQEDFE